MNDIEDQVSKALAVLAGGADGPVTGQNADQVLAVRRRARRAAAVRASVVAGALGVVVAVTAAGRAGALPFGRAERVAPAVPIRTEVPALRVDVRQDRTLNTALPNRGEGARAFIVVHVHGLVPQRPVGPQSPSGRENLPDLAAGKDGRRWQGAVIEGPTCAAGGAVGRGRR